MNDFIWMNDLFPELCRIIETALIRGYNTIIDLNSIQSKDAEWSL